MKRLIKVLLCITLITALFGCMNKEIPGNYTLTSASSTSEDDESIAVALGLLRVLGVSIDLKLYKDKTGKLMVLGQEVPLTYDRKTISFTDEDKTETMTYTYKEGTLTLTNDKATLVFEKQPGN